MANINLLPWREELRKQLQRQFISTSIFTVILALILVFLIHTYIQSRISAQTQRNNFLHQQITMLNHKIAKIKTLDSTKRALLNRMKIIEKLEASRPAIVHMFQQLVTTLPQNAYLTNFQQHGSQIKISGVADSNARVSQYMRNLDLSPWLNNAKLIVITAKPTKIGTLSDFQLTASLTLTTNHSKARKS